MKRSLSVAVLMTSFVITSGFLMTYGVSDAFAQKGKNQNTASKDPKVPLVPDVPKNNKPTKPPKKVKNPKPPVDDCIPGGANYVKWNAATGTPVGRYFEGQLWRVPFTSVVATSDCAPEIKEVGVYECLSDGFYLIDGTIAIHRQRGYRFKRGIIRARIFRNGRALLWDGARYSNIPRLIQADFSTFVDCAAGDKLTIGIRYRTLDHNKPVTNESLTIGRGTLITILKLSGGAIRN